VKKKPIRQKPAGHLRKAAVARPHPSASEPYRGLVDGIKELLENARRTSARAVNAIMTATYWKIGRRIVEYEQGGEVRAEYGEALLETLAHDLTERFGRGFSYPNLNKFRQFYLAFPQSEILSTLSIESHSSRGKPPREARRGSARKSRAARILQTVSAESVLSKAAARFPLPWSAYVRLLAVKNQHARRFYETEALRNGWSVRQLGRQIDAQFYERMALSRNKAAILKKSPIARQEDAVSAEEEVKDPYVLEFLDLRDEYSETDLEQALIQHLESFLLELGGDFCFVGRQKGRRASDEKQPERVSMC
jgi:predicted nuclease of restriction endonuclease-like (RecB) superfamily